MSRCGYQDLVSGNVLDLGDTVRVTENDTDLRWCETLLGHLADLVDNLLWARLQYGIRCERRSYLEPRWRGTTVRQSGLTDSLSFRV
jgi:hypothetical protein